MVTHFDDHQRDGKVLPLFQKRTSLTYSDNFTKRSLCIFRLGLSSISVQIYIFLNHWRPRDISVYKIYTNLICFQKYSSDHSTCRDGMPLLPIMLINLAAESSLTDLKKRFEKLSLAIYFSLSESPRTHTLQRLRTTFVTLTLATTLTRQLGHCIDTLRAKKKKRVKASLFLLICATSLVHINWWLAPLEKTVDFDCSDQKSRF